MLSNLHVTSNMEFRSNCDREPNDRKTSKANTCLSNQPKEKQKLGSILNFDKCDRTYDDFHPQVLKNAGKSKEFPLKQQVGKELKKSEELVMYMSCLPNYLASGETPQDKPFNIGVLDWRLLQKWQHGYNGIIGINGDSAPSTSNTTSLLSSKGSGSHFIGTDGTASAFKGNGEIHNAEAPKVVEQVPSSAVIDHDFSERCKTADPNPINDQVIRHFAVGHQSDSPKAHNNRLVEENGYTSSGESNGKVCHTKSRSDYTRFFSVSNEHGTSKDLQVEKSFAQQISSANCSFVKEQTMQFPEIVSIGPSRRNSLEQKSSGSKPIAENENVQIKVGGVEPNKVRNSSPTRRFSFGMVRIGKNSNSKSSAMENLVSEKIPNSKVNSTSACSNSTAEKSKAASRARLSPLRRLLDPILKPEKNPSKSDRTSKSYNGQIKSAAIHSVTRTLDVNGSRTDETCGPHHAQKNGASSVQALLQVAVKNGLPLFTFTVDNCSDILAATVKELSSNKSMRRWIYTFFSFSETKKKNNSHWIHKGSGDRNHGYIPNIVAQMKVSDINSSGREFVLSSVGVGGVDQTSDSFPGNELAAIVVKFPERTSTQRGTFDIPQIRNCSNSWVEEGNESTGDDLFSTTVILAGGHHGAPSKGDPSPLIERWKSGGSCDCGGWDLGCQLKILANNNQSNWRFKPTKSQSNSFRLFSQEEVEDERQPVFTFSAFEDGIFSVEFNSSLKLIQAFSIAIAVVHNGTSAALSLNLFGGEEIMASENTERKSFNQARVEVSAKYAANPPLSPVGRV